jgi:dipeptidyl aminopeptidase/acylaminoacyl peptidase
MNGSLAFIPDPAVNTALEWRDLSGKLVSTIPVPPARYIAASIAPDQTRAALVKPEAGAPPSVWVVDLARSTAVPVGTTIRGAGPPVWSPDSRRLAFVDLKDGRRQLSVKTAADASPPQRVAGLAGNSAIVRSWTTGEFLLNQIDPETKWNVYRLPETGAGELTPVIHGPGIEVGGWVSPTRRWMAYASDESGRLDLFVQLYPNGGAKQQISTTGVQFIGWDRDDGRVFFLTRDQAIWRVDLKLSAGGASQIGTPTQLGTFPATLISADFVAERQQFLALVRERSGVDAITIVQAWRAATR